VGDWRTKLLEWYGVNKRDLPWRNTNDPYKIWLSEVILQQTRVQQGWQYYLRFIEKYPTVSALATDPQHDVLKLWQGLGYYSRARNLHEAARFIKAKYKGKFPKEYESIRALKGVGDYTAGAVASIAFNLPFPAVDGNVMRVYSRLFGITAPINSSKGKKELSKIAGELLPHETPGIYNQAVMELGAMVCLPAKPHCENCPIQEACYAYLHKKVSEFPVKDGKTKQRNRYFNYLVIIHAGKILIRLRTAKDIWQNLYDFPMLETTKRVSTSAFLKNKRWEELIHLSKPVIDNVSEEYVHILSHQKLHARFYKINMATEPAKIPGGCSWIKLKDMENYAVPRLIELYIRKIFLK